MCLCSSVKEVKAAFVCNQVKTGSNRRKIHTYVEKIWKMPVFPTWLRLTFLHGLSKQITEIKSRCKMEDKVWFLLHSSINHRDLQKKELLPLSPEARWDTPLKVMPIFINWCSSSKINFLVLFPSFVNRSYFITVIFHFYQFYVSSFFIKQKTNSSITFKPNNFKGYLKF